MSGGGLVHPDADTVAGIVIYAGVVAEL